MVSMNCMTFSVVFLFSTMAHAAEQVTTHASQSVTDSAAASGHAGSGVVHGMVASGQVISAVAAVPLLSGAVVSGSVGAVSARVGRDSLRAAATPIGTPLEVTDEVITVMPPNKALKTKGYGQQ